MPSSSGGFGKRSKGLSLADFHRSVSNATAMTRSDSGIMRDDSDNAVSSIKETERFLQTATSLDLAPLAHNATTATPPHKIRGNVALEVRTSGMPVPGRPSELAWRVSVARAGDRGDRGGGGDDGDGDGDGDDDSTNWTLGDVINRVEIKLPQSHQRRANITEAPFEWEGTHSPRVGFDVQVTVHFVQSLKQRPVTLQAVVNTPATNVRGNTAAHVDYTDPNGVQWTRSQPQYVQMDAERLSALVTKRRAHEQRFLSDERHELAAEGIILNDSIAPSTQQQQQQQQQQAPPPPHIASSTPREWTERAEHAELLEHEEPSPSSGRMPRRGERVSTEWFGQSDVLVRTSSTASSAAASSRRPPSPPEEYGNDDLQSSGSIASNATPSSRQNLRGYESSQTFKRRELERIQATLQKSAHDLLHLKNFCGNDDMSCVQEEVNAMMLLLIRDAGEFKDRVLQSATKQGWVVDDVQPSFDFDESPPNVKQLASDLQELATSIAHDVEESIILARAGSLSGNATATSEVGSSPDVPAGQQAAEVKDDAISPFTNPSVKAVEDAMARLTFDSGGDARGNDSNNDDDHDDDDDDDDDEDDDSDNSDDDDDVSARNGLDVERLLLDVDPGIEENRIPLEDIVFRGQNYMGPHNRLGIGGFGEVFKGKYVGTTVAVKRLIDQSGTDVLREFAREVSVLRKLRHPHVVLWMGVIIAPQQLSIVLEYMDRGSLSSVVHKMTPDGKAFADRLTTGMKMTWSSHIAEGMAYLHSKHIIHRDLTSNNVLMNKKGQAKITDFGLSKVKTSRLSQTSSAKKHGAAYYCAPEALRNDPYDYPCDVFSFGVILWELMHRQRPFYGVDIYPFIASVQREGSRFIRSTLEWNEAAIAGVPQVKDIALRCWLETSKDRPTFQQLVGELVVSQPTVT
ncbi:protein kinase domain-containing protein [Pseudoscourfieldia marina]